MYLDVISIKSSLHYQCKSCSAHNSCDNETNYNTYHVTEGTHIPRCPCMLCFVQLLCQVCIVGSGNWGSAIARLVGYNAARLPDRFQKEVIGKDF